MIESALSPPSLRAQRGNPESHAKTFACDSGLPRRFAPRNDGGGMVFQSKQKLLLVCFEWPKGTPGPINVEIVDYH